MLEPNELKLVLDTLGKRRAWLNKTVADPSLAEEAKKPHIEMMQIMDSALQKLAKLGNNAAAASPPAIGSLNKIRGKLTAANARILVADDNIEACELTANILNDAGFKMVDTAEDGIEAFDKIKGAELPFDVILCDWDMPVLSGLEMHKKAKASNTLRGAHFIMVTANSEATSIRKAIQQGINDYIVKPVNAEVLVNKINVALGLTPPEEKPKAQSQA